MTGFDIARREVLLDEDRISNTTLILATGASHHYTGNDAWKPFAPGLKSIEDAVEIRRRVFTAFERAEREADAAARQELMTFVIVGGGPTGVELAGAIGELCITHCEATFEQSTRRKRKSCFCRSTDRILPTFSDQLSHKAAVSLKKLGVTVCTNTPVTDIRADVVEIRNERQERVHTGKNRPVECWRPGFTAGKAVGSSYRSTDRSAGPRDCRA